MYINLVTKLIWIAEFESILPYQTMPYSVSLSICCLPRQEEAQRETDMRHNVSLDDMNIPEDCNRQQAI